MNEEILLQDFPVCQNCKKFKDCKNLKGTKCIALNNTYFDYDCPFYTEKLKPSKEAGEFDADEHIEYLKYLLDNCEKLNLKAVGTLSDGTKYDLTKPFLKKAIRELEA